VSEASQQGIRVKGPLANSYLGAVALVVFALTPYLALSTGLTPLGPIFAKSIGLSQQGLELTTGMANAGYAFGTVLAVQLAVHLRGRRLLILYAALFVLGSILAAGAWTPGLFIAGRVLQGFCTSLMLIAAVPPLVIGWPAKRMPWTGAVMNMCIFGAVAVGPVIGGVSAGAGGFRALFWAIAGLGGLALLFALLTFEDAPAQDRSAPWDFVAQTLAGGGCAAAFFGASQLTTHPFTSLIVFFPLLAGAAMIAALVVHQYRVQRPLMPLRAIATTLPVSGVVIAMTAGAASVALIELAQTVLATRASPTHAAMLFWPEFGGAVAAAFLFRVLFKTRLVPLFALAGMVLIAAAAAVMSGMADGPNALIAVGSGLAGLGIGASVSPALFLAGFSLESEQIQRVFALIELLRGVAAFMVAPILLHLAETVGGSETAGIGIAVWVCFGIVAGGGALAAYLMVLGRVRLRPPRLEPWLENETTAYDSPPLAAGVRGEGLLALPGERGFGGV
jgi:MFS family permease